MYRASRRPGMHNVIEQINMTLERMLSPENYQVFIWRCSCTKLEHLFRILACYKTTKISLVMSNKYKVIEEAYLAHYKMTKRSR